MKEFLEAKRERFMAKFKQNVESLDELDKDEIKDEYKFNKKISPTHPDPESARYYDKVFPKPNQLVEDLIPESK